MLQIVYRVVLAAVWLVIGVGLLFFRELMPPRLVAGRDAAFLSMFGLLALVLSVYNVMRLVAHLRRQAARARLAANPLRPQPGGETPPPRERTYIPELDFTGNGPPGEATRPDEPKAAGNG